MTPHRKAFAAAAAAIALVASVSARADEIYFAVGIPGVMLGYGHPVNDVMTLRAEVATLGSQTIHRSINGGDYDVTLKDDRLGFFADYFLAKGFRGTGGVTFGNGRGELSGRANGATITIGNTTYAAGPDDKFSGQAVYPRTMPYLGIGWGHQRADTKGWTFVADLGLAFGRPKVSGSASGPLLSNAVSQQDTQSQVDKVRSNLDKFGGIPQLSLGVGYGF